jgi:undecaprenyl-diphosphatase
MDASLFVIVLLGIVEGLTEFIPVSSTGHLVLAGSLLGFESEAAGTFEIVIQLGAILAVLVAYYKRFTDVLVGLGRREAGPIAFTRNIVLGVVPAMAVGFFIYDQVKMMLDSPVLVAIALIVGGITILVLERLVKTPRVTSVEHMGWRTALGVGVVQCLSMVPGVSRSGATIMGALSLGVERKTAAEYSFFLAVPTMLAASGYDLYRTSGGLGSSAWLAIGLGFIVSFIVALVVIRWFVGVVSHHGFAPFAWYRIVVGSLALVWFLMR